MSKSPMRVDAERRAAGISEVDWCMSQNDLAFASKLTPAQAEKLRAKSAAGTITVDERHELAKFNNSQFSDEMKNSNKATRLTFQKVKAVASEAVSSLKSALSKKTPKGGSVSFEKTVDGPDEEILITVEISDSSGKVIEDAMLAIDSDDPESRNNDWKGKKIGSGTGVASFIAALKKLVSAN